ncbi:MAG: ComF family protein, partial [Ilumatobacteraceae bacterium]
SVEYRGAVRDMVAEFKFRSRRRAARSLAERLVTDIRRDPSSPSIDVVTWAPTSRRRAGARGYDQSELLARIVARRLGVPCRRLLERERGLAQTGRSRGDRLQGPVFRARPMKDALDVLVIDDVVTTGATLRAAAHALRLAGAADVHVRALASTPTPFRGSRGV